MMTTKEHSIQSAKRVLLVIDIQNYFFSSLSPAYLKGSERILPIVDQLIRDFIEHHALVLGTVHSGYNENMEKWWGHSVEEKWTIPMIKDIPIIRKSTYDAFVGTDLETTLHMNSVQQLFICGAMTHLCCETTARTGFVKGYDIVMVKDACVSKSRQHHEYSLHNLAHGIATILESQDIRWE